MRRENVLGNFIWRFAERCGAQLVSFVVSIVLARILMPEAYGTISLISVFITILGVFIDCGMSSALIQKKDADDLDFSTVFYMNIVFCTLLYILLFFCAPFIAGFYNNQEITLYVRVTGLTLIISGVKNIQSAYVSRNMLFKRFFFATLGGTIGAAIIGIWMALKGFGVWALIAQSLFNNIMDTIILWFTVDWRPKKVFSFLRLKSLFSYSWKMLASGLLDKIYNNLCALLIGKIYSPADLAYYNRGQGWPNLIVGNINSSIDSVLFPAMSSVQDSCAAVKSMTRRAIKTSTYIMAPLLMGLCFVSVPLIRLILTEKWMQSVFFMRIFCITSMFYPIHTANLNAIKAMGRSDLFLKLEIVKKIVGMIALLSTMWISVRAMAYSALFTSIASQIINSWPNKKLMGYGYLEQLKDILPGILLAVGMGICILPVQLLGLSDFLTLCIQVLLGALVYLGGSMLFKLETFEYLWNIVKPFIRINKKK